MQLNDIRYFIALTETLNFTRAAETCNVSQPALTRAIHKMEEELGGLLFSRERNNTHLTDLGRLVEPHLHEIVSRTGHVEKLATRFIRLERAALSVGVMCTIGPVLFASFLGRFRADHPGVELSLLEGVPDRLCAMLLECEIDVAIMAAPGGFSPEFRADLRRTLRHRLFRRASLRPPGQRAARLPRWRVLPPADQLRVP